MLNKVYKLKNIILIILILLFYLINISYFIYNLLIMLFNSILFNCFYLFNYLLTIILYYLFYNCIYLFNYLLSVYTILSTLYNYWIFHLEILHSQRIEPLTCFNISLHKHALTITLLWRIYTKAINDTYIATV